MIVDAAVLADFPANGHALEELVFENKIAGVIPFREKKIFVERFGLDGVLDDVVLDVFKSEVALGNSGEAFDPVGDGELLRGKLFRHGRKIIPPKRGGETRKEEIRGQNTIFCRVIRHCVERRLGGGKS